MGNFPAWWTKRGGGRKKCDICGMEYYMNENKLRRRRGLWVCPEDYDTVTDKERDNSRNK